MRSEIEQIAKGPTALGAGSPFRVAPLGGHPALAIARERSRTAIWSDVEGIEASVPTIDLPGKVIVGELTTSGIVISRVSTALMVVVFLACRVGRGHDLEQKQRRESELCFRAHRDSPCSCMSPVSYSVSSALDLNALVIEATAY